MIDLGLTVAELDPGPPFRIELAGAPERDVDNAHLVVTGGAAAGADDG